MLLSVNEIEMLKVLVCIELYTHHKQPVLFFNRYVTVDAHVFQVQIWQSKQLVKLL